MLARNTYRFIIALSILWMGMPVSAQIRTATIKQAEYFWDEDPGEGSANALVALDGNFNKAIEQVFTSSLNMPSEGYHTFHIRIMDEDGTWGSTFDKTILVNQALSSRDIKVMQGEYFWDTDPGQGLGETLLALDGNFNQAIEQVFADDITMPSQGPHVFSIRLKDEDGIWGNTFSKTLLVNASMASRDLYIQQAEYFWDEDPGEGSANALVALDGNFNKAIEQVFTSSLNMPSEGYHTFHIRIMDEDGTWGSTFDKTILVNQALSSRDIKVMQGEYFWDTDPGQGLGETLLALDGNFNQAIEQVFADDITMPSQGPHVFSIRLKDEDGIWGNTFSKTLLVNASMASRDLYIQQAEYFWDEDPGEGSANALVALDGNFNKAIEQVFTSSLNMPSEGYHTFHIRIMDEDGTWGSTFDKTILVNQALSSRDIKVMQGEYFWDTDPGQGLGETLLALDGNFNQAIEQVFADDITMPSQGPHVFSIRLKDEDGIWGNTFSKTLLVNASMASRDLYIQQAEYFWDEDPGEGSANALVALDGNFNKAIEQVFTSSLNMPSEGYHTFHIRIMDEDGTWGSTFDKTILVNQALSSRDIKVMQGEYFWDTDPGQGLGETLLALDGNFNQAIEQVFADDITMPSQGPHVFSIRLKDEDGIWGNTFSKTLLVNASMASRDLYIQQAEYFWDEDPGEGSANALVALDGNFNKAIEQVFTSSLNMPSEGYHTFHIRIMDEDGTWGSTFDKTILVNQALSSRDIKVMQGEYFWDTDPGQGLGETLLALDGNFNQAIEQVFADDITMPSQGPHVFSIRLKDEDGIWGNTFSKTLLVNASMASRDLYIQQAEYFWDEDPGEGSANALVALDGNFNKAIEQVFTSSLNMPSEGYHTFHIRIMDEDGTWGSTFDKTILVNQALSSRDIKVMQGEYFWDTDPGQGLGETLLALDGNFNQAIEQVFADDISMPSEGTHVFNIRLMDEDGTWGSTFSKTVQILFITIYGCTDEFASNYDENANTDDESCIVYGCIDSISVNFNANATDDDGSCNLQGCTDSLAHNYNPDANLDDESCKYLNLSCSIPQPHIGNTGNNMTFMLTSSFVSSIEVSYPEEAYLVAKSSSNIVVGSVFYSDSNGEIGLSQGQGTIGIWGDDFQTSELDGALNNDSIFLFLVDGYSIYKIEIDPLNYTTNSLEILDYPIITSFMCSSLIDQVIEGCTDSTAINYNPSANTDDGTCIELIEGCTDSTAFNYNPFANTDDGTCIELIEGCTDSTAFNYNPFANTDDGTCIELIEGCTDSTAFNFNPFANTDDGTCIELIEGCTDSTAINYNPFANTDDGTCIEFIEGCTDSTAFNYNPFANTDDGTCIELIEGCTDSTAINYNPFANTDDGTCIELIEGCTDSTAFNFNPLATDNDGSCEAVLVDCMNPAAENYNSIANTPDNDLCEYSPLNPWGPGGGSEEAPTFITSNSMSVLFPVENLGVWEGVDLVEGDIIFAIYETARLENELVGYSAVSGIQMASALVWTGAQVGMPVFGSDNNLDNGFQEFESLVWLVQKADGVVYNTNLTYATAGFDGTYQDGEFVIVSSVSIGAPFYDGCMDPYNANFNPLATNDDGSCAEAYSIGCMDADKVNFAGPGANPTHDNAENFGDAFGQNLGLNLLTGQTSQSGAAANISDDSMCQDQVEGCTDAMASNYDPIATQNDATICDWSLNGMAVYDVDVNGNILDTVYNFGAVDPENQNDGILGSQFDNANILFQDNSLDPDAHVIANLASVMEWIDADELADSLELDSTIKWWERHYFVNDSTWEKRYNDTLDAVAIWFAADELADSLELDSTIKWWERHYFVNDSTWRADFDTMEVYKDSVISVTNDTLDYHRAPIEIDLHTQWNTIAYYLQHESSVILQFENQFGTEQDVAANINIVKNNEGKFYWPDFAYDGLGMLVPGQGYQVRVKDSSDGKSDFIFEHSIDADAYRTLNPTVPAWAIDMPVDVHPNDVRSLVRVVNMLGQEVNSAEQFKGEVLLYMYNDGSVEKKMVK